jgi:hypothetical protein
MNAGNIVENITDACEPYSPGEPDLYDLPIYANGRMVSGVKIVSADKLAGDRIELITGDQTQTITRSINVDRSGEGEAYSVIGLACFCGVLIIGTALIVLGSL